MENNTESITEGPAEIVINGNYIAENLWSYMPSLFLILGTVSNTLSVVLFLRSEMRKHSSFVYFAILNIVNLGALYVNCIRGVMEFNFGIDIRSYSLFICKLHVFLTYFLSHLSSLILSIIGVDRVISVMLLHLAKKVCTPRLAIYVTICLVVFNFLLSSHFLYMESGYKTVSSSIESNQTIVIENVICDIRDGTEYHYFVNNVWKLIDMSMYAFIPFVIMLTSSLIIILRIAQQSKRLKNHSKKNGSIKETRFNTRTRNLALMLIPVNIMFLIFVGPVVVAIYTYDDLGKDHLALLIVEGLSLCNFTLNFFIYFATSSKFREEFYKLMDEISSKFKKNERFKWLNSNNKRNDFRVKNYDGSAKNENIALTSKEIKHENNDIPTN